MRKEKPKRKQEFWSNGNILSEEFRNRNGEWHNDAGPAIRRWYENGQLAYEFYYLHGKSHNAAGPAYREWHENGVLESEEYWLNGRQLISQALLRDCSARK